jgi:hypothetical protein
MAALPGHCNTHETATAAVTSSLFVLIGMSVGCSPESALNAVGEEGPIVSAGASIRHGFPLEIEPRAIDLGTIIGEETAEHSLSIRNHGAIALTLGRIETSLDSHTEKKD